MKTIVRYHSSTKKDLIEWINHNNLRRAGHPAQTELLIDEIAGELKRTEGQPQGAVFVPTLDPPRWIWRYSADTWIGYVMRIKRHGLFGSSTLEIIIVSVASLPPA